MNEIKGIKQSTQRVNHLPTHTCNYSPVKFAPDTLSRLKYIFICLKGHTQTDSDSEKFHLLHSVLRTVYGLFNGDDDHI